MSALTTLESRLSAAWHDLTTDVREELQAALADTKAEVAALKPVLQTFEADLKSAIATAEPGVQSTVEGLLSKLLADVVKIAGADLGM